MTIGAIETSYKGYRFRSRLEARWAVFFDALGYEWQYEPQGFQKAETCFEEGTEEEGDVIRYLPDFYLPRTETWVEIKGSDELLEADRDRLENILDWGSPLPGFDDSEADSVWSRKIHGLLLLGEIPDPTRFGINFHQIVRHYKGLVFRWAYFTPTQIKIHPECELLECFEGPERKDWTTVPLFAPVPRAWPAVLNAYRAARSARFEHGQRG